MKKRDKRLIKSEGVSLKRARYVKARFEKNRLAKAAKKPGFIAPGEATSV